MGTVKVHSNKKEQKAQKKNKSVKNKMLVFAVMMVFIFGIVYGQDDGDGTVDVAGTDSTDANVVDDGMNAGDGIDTAGDAMDMVNNMTATDRASNVVASLIVAVC